jgi:hypothetical protein
MAEIGGFLNDSWTDLQSFDQVKNYKVDAICVRYEGNFF